LGVFVCITGIVDDAVILKVDVCKDLYSVEVNADGYY
jgi:hypothetical protein